MSVSAKINHIGALGLSDPSVSSSNKTLLEFSWVIDVEFFNQSSENASITDCWVEIDCKKVSKSQKEKLNTLLGKDGNKFNLKISGDKLLKNGGHLRTQCRYHEEYTVDVVKARKEYIASHQSVSHEAISHYIKNEYTEFSNERERVRLLQDLFVENKFIFKWKISRRKHKVFKLYPENVSVVTI